MKDIIVVRSIVPLAYRIAEDKNNIPDFAWLLSSKPPTQEDIDWAKKVKKLHIK